MFVRQFTVFGAPKVAPGREASILLLAPQVNLGCVIGVQPHPVKSPGATDLVVLHGLLGDDVPALEVQAVSAANLTAQLRAQKVGQTVVFALPSKRGSRGANVAVVVERAVVVLGVDLVHEHVARTDGLGVVDSVHLQDHIFIQP